jgi:uncharacterized membrane protein YecN with MAPEG domain
MDAYYPVAVVTLLVGITLFGMALTVARTHAKTGILAPTMSGDPRLERAIRAHMNTSEWALIFLPAMWLFASYWDVTWAAIFGALWVIARVVYFVGYLAAPEKRYPGFLVQVLMTSILLFGALGRIIFLWIA